MFAKNFACKDFAESLHRSIKSNETDIGVSSYYIRFSSFAFLVLDRLSMISHESMFLDC